MSGAHRAAVREEYKDASHLDARIRLHALYSTNKQPFHEWVFDQLNLPAQCRVLEVGAGSGRLWVANSNRIPPGWKLTLGDLSPGILTEARRHLAGCSHLFHFAVLDTQALPFCDAVFDAVIANHMLYHVPDRPAAYAEFRRVLKPGGRLYAATNGRYTMREYDEIVSRAAHGESRVRGVSPITDSGEQTGFNLENGAAELSRVFPIIVLHRREDSLLVTETEPLVAYAEASENLSPEEIAALHRIAEENIAREGSMRITKDVGMFEAW